MQRSGRHHHGAEELGHLPSDSENLGQGGTSVMKRSSRDAGCSKLLFLILIGSLLTALIIFLTLQVTILSSQQNTLRGQDGNSFGRSEAIAKNRVEELSESLLHVAEQVEKLKGALLTLQTEAKVVTEQVGKRDSLEQVVDGMHQEIRALKSELKSELKSGRLATPKVPPLNLYMGNSIVMCWIDFFHTYFFLDSRDRGVTPHLCQGSVWERKITEAVEKVVLPGQNVVDVGASIGWYTAAFMRAVGPTGRVLSIEANPRLSDLLGRTVQSNPNVKIVNKAVGNEDDKKVFIENDMSWSPGNKVVDKANNAVQVDYIKLDTLLQDEAWHQVDVIKVDVEGHESQVWKGMQDILNDNPNVALILEVNTERDKASGVDSKKFYEELSKRFKKISTISGDDGSFKETSPSDLLSMRGNVLLYLKNEARLA